jgi:tetratricopeptide (TPR) repeat protein
MKKIILGVALILSVATYAQKDELKTLKKLYSKEKLSASDIESYKATLSLLESSATEESDKVYKNFYSGMLPILELNSLGEKATPADQIRIFNPSSLENFSNSISETLTFEKKSGKEIYTKDIEETLSWFKPMLQNIAFQLNSASKFKEASKLFYNIYKIDKNDGSNLENAAILALQSEDYIYAEKIYTEYKESDYLENGLVYYAVNKANDTEEQLPNKQDRTNRIKIGTHEKPRDEKVSLKKPEVYKVVAVLLAQNGKIELAKKAYAEAKELNPNDIELLINEANLYYSSNDLVTYENLIKEVIKKDPKNASLHYNVGYLSLSQDQSIVDELNANINNTKKYNELLEKRKSIFKNALPHFETAYKLNSSDVNTKTILKMTYEVLGMKDKAATIK